LSKSSIKNITEYIHRTRKDNFIVKIMGENLGKNLGRDISEFNLKNYDLIYFIERKDFFDQCCSFQVCWNYDVWNNNHSEKYQKLYEKIQTEHLTLSKKAILNQAHSIYNYIILKKYVINNTIPFVQKYYESETFDSNIDVRETNLCYENIFTNYNIKESINLIFDATASYENLYFDIVKFIKNLHIIDFYRDSNHLSIKEQFDIRMLEKSIISWANFIGPRYRMSESKSDDLHYSKSGI